MVDSSKNLNAIITHIGGSDYLSPKPTEIDSPKEYNLLGQYLNGSYQIQGCSKESLSKKEIKFLSKMLNSLEKKWGKYNNNKVEDNIITKDNVLKYIDKLAELGELKNKGLIDEKPIMQIEDLLYNFLKDLHLPDIERLDPHNTNYRYIIEHSILPIINNIEDGKKVAKAFEAKDNKQKLIEAVEEYKNNNNIDYNNHDGIDIGDGDFDEMVTQKADVCSFLAGINALASSKGKIILQRNSYRDPESGVFAIHLQEAEDCNLPSKGIYIITPQEIIDAKDTVAEGEGDSVAYLLAINKYFKELKETNPEQAKTFDETGLHTGDIKKGNYNTRFFNILTGAKTTELNAYNMYNYSVPIGINMGENIDFSTVYDIVEKQKGAATFSIQGGSGAHAISIVGVKDGSLLVQESNNNPKLFLSQYGTGSDNLKVFEQTESYNGFPTYTLSKEIFDKISFSTCLVRWEY